MGETVVQTSALMGKFIADADLAGIPAVYFLFRYDNKACGVIYIGVNAFLKDSQAKMIGRVTACNGCLGRVLVAGYFFGGGSGIIPLICCQSLCSSKNSLHCIRAWGWE